jgi:hypothetical protein
MDPARLKGVAMINPDDVQDGIKELERAARLGLAGAMITEHPLEHRRYDGSVYEPFWAAAAALDLPLGLHTATRQQGRIRGAGDKTLRDASSRRVFYPALSMCDLIFSGVFERHPRLRVAIVEFELAWAPHLLSTMDYTYRERHGEAIYRFEGLPSRRRGDGMLPKRLLPPQDADGKSLLGLIRAPTRAYRSCRTSLASAALLARPCALLTLSELSFTVREVYLSFGPQTHHEPVGRRVATIDLRDARVRPQGCTRDHRGRQWGGR